MRFFSMTLLLALLLAACAMPGAGREDALEREAMETYADIVFASYDDSYQSAVAMQQSIDAFLAEPTEGALAAARGAWLTAREPYGQTESYRFYGGPIDGDEGPEGRINSWPLDEQYIDYVEGQPEVGIIAQVEKYPALDAPSLAALNQTTSEESISTGYHAIEFLLWGQDRSVDGPGQRPASDYTTAPHAERRAEYLRSVTTLLVEDLATLRAAWDPQPSESYRTAFLARDPDQAIQQMLTGIGVLSKSELAGERVYTAYDNQDQEDEHSCFSDNTHRDIYNNALGIRNVYRGEYRRLDGTTLSGTGLQALVARADPALDSELGTLLDGSVAQAEGLPVPFDQAIIHADSRPQILALVNALQDQGDKLAEIGSALGLTINTTLP